jgi:hypothetical protein
MLSHSPKGFSKLLKNAHLRRYPHPSSLRRTAKYASFLTISGALHLAVFEQPEKDAFPSVQLAPLVFFSELFDDLWNEKGKDEEAYREENLERK